MYVPKVPQGTANGPTAARTRARVGGTCAAGCSSTRCGSTGWAGRRTGCRRRSVPPSAVVHHLRLWPLLWGLVNLLQELDQLLLLPLLLLLLLLLLLPLEDLLLTKGSPNGPV